MDKKISVAIIGVQKAATSSLYTYLIKHPSLTGHDKTFEFSYFLRDEEYELGLEKIWKNYYKSSENDNLNIIKNAGIIFVEKAIKRLHDHNPDAMLILALRNPVDRAYSGYHFAKWRGAEHLSTFEEAISAGTDRFTDETKRNLCSYLERGYYDIQIRTLLKYFPKEQIKIVLHRDIKNSSIKILQEICEFLDIDSSLYLDSVPNRNPARKPLFPILFRLIYGDSKAKELLKKMLPDKNRRKLKRKVLKLISIKSAAKPLNQKTKNELIEHFKQHNIELSKLIDRDLTYWNE